MLSHPEREAEGSQSQATPPPSQPVVTEQWEIFLVKPQTFQRTGSPLGSQVFACFFLFLPHPWHAEVPWPGIKPPSQQ